LAHRRFALTTQGYAGTHVEGGVVAMDVQTAPSPTDGGGPEDKNGSSWSTLVQIMGVISGLVGAFFALVALSMSVAMRKSPRVARFRSSLVAR
jgi:hypothetical protein